MIFDINAYRRNSRMENDVEEALHNGELKYRIKRTRKRVARVGMEMNPMLADSIRYLDRN